MDINTIQRTNMCDVVKKDYFYSQKPFLKRFMNYKYLYLMLLPGIAYYLVFQYAPMYGIVIAFKDFNILKGVFASPWVGFKYFNMLFASDGFWVAFRNTIIISGFKLLFNFPAPIILALLLNEVRNMAFKKTVQTISYLPHFLSWVILSGLVINFLSPSTGPINVLLNSLGIKPIFFVGDPKWFRPVVIISDMWKEIGWGTIIYLASLSSVDVQLYEASVMDGAGRFKQTFHITLPAMAPVIIIMFIFAVGSIVSDDFDQIYNLYNPVVYDVGDVLSTFVYRMGLENALYSFSTAAGLFRNVIAFVLIITTNKISSYFSDYSLW